MQQPPANGWGGDTAAAVPDPGDWSPADRAEALERRAPAPLTPWERHQRRRSRQKLTVFALVGVGLGVITLLAAVVAGQSSPSPRPTSVPAGYKAVNDGVFAYVVPKDWSLNQAATDNAGDQMNAGPDGWVAEHLQTRDTAPSAGETPPTPFKSFGEARPTAFSIGSATPTRVPGTTTAYRYEITRPGGFTATAIDAWSGPAKAELWFLVHASPATTVTILRSLTLG